MNRNRRFILHKQERTLEPTLVANYELEVPLPHGATIFHPEVSNQTFSLENIILLPLNTNPDKPPYMNFCDTNAVIRYAGCHSEIFLDYWMALAIAEESNKRMFWEKYLQVYCLGTIGLTANRAQQFIQVLRRKAGEQVFAVEFASGGQSIHDREHSAMAFIPPKDVWGIPKVCRGARRD
jgi:hypothetical protein